MRDKPAVQGAARIVLASRSPRRQELLRQLGIEYTLVEVEVDERPRAGEPPEQFVTRIALAKARVGWEHSGPEHGLPVLGADTAVVVHGKILGKPLGRDDALSMLAQLSGCMHEVYSGVALIRGEQQLTAVSCTRVWFCALSEADRELYWRSGEPADKAGSYGIQGLGALFVERIDGSYSGVMGLPIYETAGLLAQMGVDVLRARNL